jgi:hypothetical protein
MKHILQTGAASEWTRRAHIAPPLLVRSSAEPSYVRRHRLVSPSLRLRANAANRSLLRWLRAVELSAWQDASATHRALR